MALRWHHNDPDGVSNHQPHGCLLNRLFRRRSKKTSKLRVTGLCVGNSPGPVNSPHKGPVTRKMFPFDDVIMVAQWRNMASENLVSVGSGNSLLPEGTKVITWTNVDLSWASFVLRHSPEGNVTVNAWGIYPWYYLKTTHLNWQPGFQGANELQAESVYLVPLTCPCCMYIALYKPLTCGDWINTVQ